MNTHLERLSCRLLAERFFIKKHYLLTKRLLDITVSLLVVLTFYPLLFPLIMLMIKLDSRGPVFFKQKRMGYMGTVFVCYKFRSMYLNNQADIQAEVIADTRITMVGKFLRKTCLDELPQFINVLLGDMSIVGPRPVMLLENELFSNQISNYTFRTLARPGITGLSQIIGYRGPVTDIQEMYYRYHWDIYYMRRASLGLDLWIMAKTAAFMLKAVASKKERSLDPRQRLRVVNI